MASFKQFLSEDPYALSGLIEKGFMDWCRVNASKYMDHAKDTPIFRGMKETKALGLIDTNGFNRVSKGGTPNYYTIWMDNDPKWSKFPKRSKSYICSSGSYSRAYGSVHLIVPEDSANIGICPRGDIWNSFPAMRDVYVSDIEDLVCHISDFLNSYGGSLSKKAEQDYSVLRTALVSITPESAEDNDRPYSTDWGNYLKRNHLDSMLDIWDANMGPSKNDFDQCAASTLFLHPRENVEMWVQGKCAIVALDKIDSFSKEFQEFLRHNFKLEQ